MEEKMENKKVQQGIPEEFREFFSDGCAEEFINICKENGKDPLEEFEKMTDKASAYGSNYRCTNVSRNGNTAIVYIDVNGELDMYYTI